MFEQEDRRGIRADLLETVENILFALDAADTVKVLAIPRYRLHSLKGERKGFWAVTVKANWRIVFRFEGADAFDVDLIDYH